MKDERWQREQDPVRLMMKLQEEVGEVQHAFNRRKVEDVVAEIRDVDIILRRLRTMVLTHGIPDLNTRGE